MILEKYENVFREINRVIEDFNKFLAEEFRIAPLNVSDPEFCFVINVPWNEMPKPKVCGSRGVYILCGYDEGNPEKVGAYIGEAPLRNIGGRVNFWLKQHPPKNNMYWINGRDGPKNPLILEAIAAIGLVDGMWAFASALEKFIIRGVRESVYLVNGTGN